MSPRHILNPALYADRTVQDWHRESFPTDHWAIDLDLMGACNRCREVLYLIESTTNPSKPTTILRNLAQRADVYALVVYHQAGQVTGGLLVHPKELPLASADVVRALLAWLRATHLHGECRVRRTAS